MTTTATMPKSEAQHLRQVALNALDLAHCLHTGAANEITFQAWWDEFARGKEFEAARKQWLRWKTDFKRHEIPVEFVDDGREKHVIVSRQVVKVAEKLLAEAEAALGPDKTLRRYPDQVTIKGKTYRLKVYGREIRPLTDREYAELKASIEAEGIKVAVLVDREGNVVDGKHRFIIAEELGLTEVPIAVLAEYDRAALHDLAEQLNACRRQLTKQEQAESRRRRLERIQAKRAQGQSTRQIAEEEGVSQTTIVKDLEESDPAAQVEGKDGRRQGPKKPTKEEKAQRRARIAALLAANPRLTVRELVEELGSTVGTVARDLDALAAEAQEGGSEHESAIVMAVPSSTRTRLGVDPEHDDVRTCLEAALTGLERLREKVRGTEAEALANAVHEVIDGLIWRFVDDAV